MKMADLKSLLALERELINDLSVDCPTIDRLRDMEYIAKRVEHEGLSFLTITLPQFGSALLQGLDKGKLDTTLITGFKTYKKSGLPAFMRGFLIQVFDERGILREEPSVLAIALIRQVTSIFKKIKVDCTEARKKASVHRFIEIENALGSILFDPKKEKAVFDASIVLSNVFGKIESKIVDMELIPNHGPGSTATRYSPNEKWRMIEWEEDFERLFPYSHYGMFVDAMHTQDIISSVHFYEPDKVPSARMALVQKTLETPRSITIEPCYKQFMQQALRSEFYSIIESDPDIGTQIRFLDQSVNKELARLGSIHGNLATLDLKDASDRVSHTLVELIFSHHKTLLESLNVTRSTSVKLPYDMGEIPIRKFASMGSALCFPVEAICFFTIAVAAIVEQYKLPRTMASYRFCGSLVNVYGDDIIVPVDVVGSVCEWLESFGLKVNQHKSFWTGKFRESCGGDFYNGVDITPVYCRSLPPNGRTDPSIVSWVELSNGLYKRGLWKASGFCRSLSDKTVGYCIPYAHDDTEGATYTTFVDSNIIKSSGRLCNRLHKPIARAPVPRPVCYTDKLSGYAALNKFLITPLQARPKNHLSESVKRGASAVSHRYVALRP